MEQLLAQHFSDGRDPLWRSSEAGADPCNTGRAERGRRVRDAEVAERAERNEDDFPAGRLRGNGGTSGSIVL
jgi:hypothetical protein